MAFDYQNPDHRKGRMILAGMATFAILLTLGIIGGLMYLMEAICRILT